jgi:hypothetical protein
MTSNNASRRKVTLQLKGGVMAALSRLNDVLRRSRVETVLIEHAADGNCCGWSPEESDEEVTEQNGIVSIPYEDFATLFGAIGRMQFLEEIILDYYVSHIPIKALVQAFKGDRNGARIKILSLRHVTFTGRTSDFQEFSASIVNQSTLFKVNMTSCKTPGFETSAPLVDALSSIHTIAEINLEEIKATGSSLTSLCRLPNLQALNLRHITACNTHMAAIASALGQNKSLRHLQIRYALDMGACKAVFQMLQHNTSLDSIDIDMDSWDNYGQTLAVALIANQYLRDFELNVYGNDGCIETNALTLAKALTYNTSLRRLCLTFHNRLHQSDAEQKALLDRLASAFVGPFSNIMTRNYALETLEVGLVHRRVIFDDVVMYYLKMNQAGRKKLVYQPNAASRKQWVETLIGYRDDLDVLFYFLSMNPKLTKTPEELFEPTPKRVRMQPPSA